MQIHIIPRQFKLTDAIYAFATERLAQLDGLTDRIQSAEVVLSQETASEPSERFTVKVRLVLPGRHVRASDSAGDLYAAIGHVQSKLERGLRKRKTRLTERLQRQVQRAREQARCLGEAEQH